MVMMIHNGELREAAEVRLGPEDRGLLFGDGLFETMRAYHGRVFGLRRHLLRLEHSARLFHLEIPFPAEELAEMVVRLVAANQISHGRVRITLTRGLHDGAMHLSPPSQPTLLISALPLDLNHLQTLRRGLRLATAELRFSAQNPVFQHKTLNRLPHLLARTQALAAGADEALILDEKGNVAACSTGNIFVLQADQLFTPPLSGPLLPGVTRRTVLELAVADGIHIRENFFSPLLLHAAQEVFFTNSVQEIVPVISFNARDINNRLAGPITQRLQQLYQQAVEQEDETS